MFRRALVALTLVATTVAIAPSGARGADTGPLTAWREARLALATTALAHDPSRSTVLVGADPSVPSLGNHLVEIDPHTGALGRRLPLFARLQDIAVSDDGTRAYVGFGRQSSLIVEVDLATFSEVRRIRVGPDATPSLTPNDIAVQPGRADVIAVSMGSASTYAVTIFEDGVARQQRVQTEGLFAPVNPTSLEFDPDDPSRLIGLAISVVEMAVTDTGVSRVRKWPVLGFFAPFWVHDGLVTSSSGRVLDTTTGTLLTAYPGPILTVDHPTGFAYGNTNRSKLVRYRVSDRTSITNRIFGAPGLTRMVATPTALVATSPSEVVLLGPQVTGSAFALPPAPEPAVLDRPTVTAPFHATAQVASADGRHLYVATTAADSQPESVVEVDVRTGERLRTFDPEGRPTTLALADDDATLLVGHADRSVVTEVDRSALSIRREVDLPVVNGPTVASEIAPLPDRPDDYLVRLTSLSTPGTFRAIVVVADGTILPDEERATGARYLGVGSDPEVVTGLGTGVTRLTLDAQGIEYQSSVQGLVTSPGNHARHHGDEGYLASGWVVDTERGATVGHFGAGNFAFGAYEVPAPHLDRMFFVRVDDIEEYRLGTRSTVAVHPARVPATRPIAATLAGGRIAVLSSEPPSLHLVPVLARPGAPRALHADPEPDAITLHWRRPADDGGRPVTGYRVFRDGDLVVETPATTRSFVNTSRVPATVHEYTVSAVNEFGAGPSTAPVAAAAGAGDDTDPEIELASPVDGAAYPREATVTADFSCRDEGGSGLVGCEGDVATGTTLDTSTLGEYEFTVWATDGDGNLAERTVGYRVVDVTGPTITITLPREGQSYERGAVRTVEYSCADEAGGSGVASCAGPEPSGGPVDTRRAGTHDFEVVATDHAGNRTTLTHTYRVRPALCAGRVVTVLPHLLERPTDRNDVIRIDDGPAVVNGGRGDDLICGSSAVDKLLGGPGDDRLIGGHRDDWLLGGPGNDVLEGSAGSDLLEGGPGNDRLVGGTHTDYCDGGGGTDRMSACEYFRLVP